MEKRGHTGSIKWVGVLLLVAIVQEFDSWKFFVVFLCGFI